VPWWPLDVFEPVLPPGPFEEPADDELLGEELVGEELLDEPASDPDGAPIDRACWLADAAPANATVAPVATATAPTSHRRARRRRPARGFVVKAMH
jgi:hypothetical protein